MTKFIAILIFGLLMEAIGVVYLSSGLKQIGEPERMTAAAIGHLLKNGITNRNILLGVFFEALFFGCLLYLLSQQDVSFIWPLTSLGFVVTTLAAKLFLHEQVSPVRWAGVLLIVSGAALITFSEKKKERTAPPAERLAKSELTR